MHNVLSVNRSVEEALDSLERLALDLAAEDGESEGQLATRVKRQEQPGAYDGDRGIT